MIHLNESSEVFNIGISFLNTSGHSGFIYFDSLKNSIDCCVSVFISSLLTCKQPSSVSESSSLTDSSVLECFSSLLPTSSFSSLTLSASLNEYDLSSA